MSPPTDLFTPLPISAASEPSLRALLTSYATYLSTNPHLSLHDFAHTLQTRRSTLSHRIYITATSPSDAASKLSHLAANLPITTKHTTPPHPRILGVFTGQGAQWTRMGARLIAASPFVARRVRELDAVLQALPDGERPGWRLADELLSQEGRGGEAGIAQPLCTALQIVLVDVLRLAGVKWEGVVGHSSGACLSGSQGTPFLGVGYG